MEYLDGRTQWITAGYLLMVMVSLVTGQDEVASSDSELPHNRAFFNQSQNSLALLHNSVLHMQNHMAFSFRTCSHGQLIYQEGGSGDFLRISLTQNGSLDLSWRRAGTEDSVLIGDDTLRNNKWYTVDCIFLRGVITLTIEQGSVSKFQQFVSNSTYRRYLWDLDLSGGTPIRVGDGFTGCFQEGPSLQLSNVDTIATDVRWGVCPLETMTIEGCDVTPNPCWWYPCKNGGNCVSHGSSYTCDCPPPYTGLNCEDDRGREACELAPCQNNGTCEAQETGSRTYLCRCIPGYTGIHCEIDIDECAPGPCQNGGQCLNEINHFSCNCTGTGYKGQICTENMDECMESPPCLQDAQCMDTPGSYKCKCPLGFAGRNCELGVNECESSPCQNGGSCTDNVGSYTCVCPNGYTGENCQSDIDDCAGVSCADPLMMCVDRLSAYFCRCRPGYFDPEGTAEGNSVRCQDVDECLSMPCINGGTCLDKANHYSCQCPPGFEGDQCEVNIDECASLPCNNGATCHDGINSYSCDCVPGFTGASCLTNINECHSSPCQHGGDCQDKVNGFECQCSAGWEGQFCEDEIDECASNPCLNAGNCSRCEENIDDCVPDPCRNGGRCVDMVNDYSCECLPVWMGKNCTEEYDACAFRPCQNGATCATTRPSQNFQCSCAPGFTGTTCETNIDDCIGSPCEIYQVCVDGINTYTCECPLGYEGEVCELEIDECASSPCWNGGVCNNSIGNYTCDCAGSIIDLTSYTGDPAMVYWSGWTGANCEIDVNECAYSPGVCLNEGQCKNYNGTFKCLCPQSPIYYIGPYCNTVRNFCQVVDLPDLPPCHNGGVCIPSDRSFTCNCSAGFTGERCKINIDECESSPCHYNGNCTDGVNGYTCECLPGLTGANCEINIDECESNPCDNGGICMDQINRYVCDCSDTGFKGDHCETNIDDCESSPCIHGGNCTDLIKDYLCDCYLGYEGKACGIDIDECASSPCQNGAPCQQMSVLHGEDPDYSLAAGYNCSCLPGFTGIHCEVDINECESNPCIHGTCEDIANGYMCMCDYGFTGTHCENDINECIEYWPCKNGGTCFNQQPGYSCTCPPVFQGIQYGGENCTVHLVGCMDNQCQNNASCLPMLVNEELDMHNYTCNCQRGYDGYYCEIPTSASFNGNASFLYDDGITLRNVNIKLEFRTTLSAGNLVSNVDPDVEQNVFQLYLNGSNMLCLYYRTGDREEYLHLSAPDTAVLDDANWHMIQITVEVYLMTLSLYHPVCQTGVCSVSEVIAPGQSHRLGPTLFGAPPPGVTSEGDPRAVNFIGCLQDIELDYRYIIPRNIIGTPASKNIVEGCNREDQCDPSPCNDHGTCVDLWDKFQCLCNRPYLGLQCNDSFIAATFGHENSKSYAKFDIPEDGKLDLQERNELSLLFRTRKSSGLIFFLGSNLGTNFENYNVNSTFLMASLGDGQIQVHVKLSDDVEMFGIPVRYRLDNGLQHLLNVSRVGSSLTIQVDEFSRKYDVINTLPLDAQNVLFGSLTGLSRRRRQIDDPPANSTDESSNTFPVETSDFAGTIQDIRLNGFSLELYPLNRDDLERPPTYPTTGVTNGILEGEVSGDICTLLPCQNGGTCRNIFFNDFECSCPAGYQGKNCSLPEFCLSHQCPSGYECQDLNDGYECVSNATFSEGNYLQYRHSLIRDPIFDISLRLRTRSATGIILHIQGQGQYAENYITILVNHGLFQVKLNIGQETILPLEPRKIDVANAEWWDVSIIFDRGSDSVDFSIKSESGLSQHRFVNSVLMTMTLAELLQGSENIYVGGTTESYRTSHMNMFPVVNSIEGCLGEVRVGSVLLPFHDQFATQNNDAAEQFQVIAQNGVRNGCQSKPVCDAHGCQNEATCIDIWNAFTCNCAAGFTDILCSTNINDCVIHDCENGATCIDGITNFTCACIPGFTGDKCETDIDECSSSPCQNNATCDDVLNGYNCYCAANYTGSSCEVLITDNCDSEPCQNNATCVPINGTEPGDASFNCTCLPGYTGRYCENEIDYCEGTPCLNNATCESRRDKLDYVCTCVDGFTGDNCETNVDECTSDPCHNRAKCHDEVNGYNCECLSGFEGLHCENDINECNQMTVNGSAPCEHGTCVNLPGEYYCNCSGTGYEGDRCEEDINECQDAAICQNGGSCTNLPGSYWCNCTFGYEGRNCEVANCSYNQCHNDGNCSIEDGQWKCDCLEYFEGEQCMFRGPCVDGPCRNNATCVQDHTNYACVCAKGWAGENCSEDIDECIGDNPCRNGGTCSNLPGSYQCTCSLGYTDDHCETNINECSSSPCQKGGQCIDGIAQFSCNCDRTGYTGPTCFADVDECNTTDPCNGNGDCENLPGDYTCHCYTGYLGPQCQFKNPCNDTAICNKGNCSHFINEDDEINFVCNCPEPWTGTYCETELQDPRKEPLRPTDPIPLIVGLCVAAVVLIIFIVVVVFLIQMKKKRATRGTYSPSRQEMSGTRVELDMKPPPEERLI